MTDDLIARLKAAHGMSQCHARDYCGEPGDTHTNICRIIEEDVFNEIIAALEERERMRAVVDAARPWRWDDRSIGAAMDAMDGKGRSMLKPHAPMPARNRTHTPDALDAKEGE